MNAMRLFLDSHDRQRDTFPARLSREELRAFYASYEQACAAEGVIPVRLHVGLGEGRAYCLNLAQDADAVRRAHERVGLPFDAITEVSTVAPSDLFVHD